MPPTTSIKKIDWSLYAILDREFVSETSFAKVAEDLIAGGAGLIQLRDKISSPRRFFESALAVRKVTMRCNIPLIINDRVDIAAAINADGVHLGQSDLPVREARRILSDAALIGLSVHNLTELRKAAEYPPDYFGVGTIYSTSTKSEYESKGPGVVREIRNQTDLPLVGIGGITLTNLLPVIENGADGVAVISALLRAENLVAAARQFAQAVKRTKQRAKRNFNKEAA